MPRLGCAVALVYTVLCVTIHAIYFEKTHPSLRSCQQTCTVQMESVPQTDLPPPPLLEADEPPVRPQKDALAAFETAQRNFYDKWCTSKDWNDPPSAAAAVEWHQVVELLP
jgi:hypothetical protein